MPVPPFLQRLALITGEEALSRIMESRVIVVGLGGVGSWAAEALSRSGVQNISLVDSDSVCVTNINRQVEALPSTIGKPKTEALKERLLAINPRCNVVCYQTAFCRENLDAFDISGGDFVIDAIDSLTHKIALIEETARLGAVLFSCMGMAQKLDPSQIRASSIWETRGCPLARLVRERLRKDGFAGDFTAVWSPERLPLKTGIAIGCGTAQCLCPHKQSEWCSSKKVINGSAVMVTAAAGMLLASLVLRGILDRQNLEM